MSLANRPFYNNDESLDLLGVSRVLSTFVRASITVCSGPVLVVQSPYASEQALMKNAIAKRRDEFFSGRFYARQALHEMDVTPQAIGRGEKGEPLWPANIIGSISHDKDFVVVALGHRHTLKGFGIDFHSNEHVVDTHLIPIIATENELASFTQHFGAASALTRLFSIKEAVAKALSPNIAHYLEFQQVEVFFIQNDMYARVEGYDFVFRCKIVDTSRGYLSVALY